MKSIAIKNVKLYLRQIRIKHWSKNLLVFLPLFAAHEITNFSKVKEVLLYFLCFSLIASATYIINDLLDLESDRKHQFKRDRPLASGMMTKKNAMLLFTILLSFSFLISILFFSKEAIFVLVIYLIVTFSYSIWIKQVFALDVLVLAGLYTLRILGGTFAANVLISYWLLVFSIFIFLSLGNMKRYIEIINLNTPSIPGRSYSSNDAQLTLFSGICSGYISALVMALYSQSPAVKVLYVNPEILIFVSAIILYWISYSWNSATKNKVFHDPIEWALKDRTSLLCIFFVVAITFFARNSL